MKYFILTLLFFPFTAQADELTLGDCYQTVEAIHQAMEENPVSEADATLVEGAVNRAVEACEAEKFAEGERALKDATDLYQAAIPIDVSLITEGDFWKVAQYIWGNKAHQKKIALMHKPMDCDDNPDYLGFYVNLDHPDGVFFDVLAVTKEADGELRYAYTSLPYDNDAGIGLCHREGEHPFPTLELKAGVDTSFFNDAEHTACPNMLIIDDGMCDKIHLAWQKEGMGKKPDEHGGETEVPFLLHRN